MSTEQKKSLDYLYNKFPRMQPLKGAPTLFTMNGIGVKVYGRRDYDAETGTYVKTRCLCLFFIPVLALDAFRVADADGGAWFFLGKERLSGFARNGNLFSAFLVLLFAMMIGWSIHTSSPEYRAGEDLEKAADFLKNHQPVRAAGEYRKLLTTTVAAKAREGLKSALEACLASEEPKVVATGVHLLTTLPASLKAPNPIIADPVRRSLALAKKFQAKDPDLALGILRDTAELDPKNESIKPARMAMLKEIIAARPDATNQVVELALIYEADKQLPESVQLLLPYQQRLGATEGARILGQHLLSEGRNDEAYALLHPYVIQRLDRLHAIEKSYNNALEGASKRALADLNNGSADHTFYETYKASNKDAQKAMVDEYIQTRVKNDPQVRGVIMQLKEANQIVPVALDLGIIQLNRAQSLGDPAARKTELEAAEKTFLAVRSFAGKSDEYRLFLGQVYYWLGKSADGKALFDELLAAHNRQPTTLLSIATTLRDVGETVDARTLAEEAFASARESKERYAAAALRALLNIDLDDQIAWLEKSDIASANVQIQLNSARGNKALQQGNKPAAAKYFRAAIDGYDKLPKNPATLNNCALVCFTLFEAAGDVPTYNRGVNMLDEAVRLAPSDSILIQNALHHLVTAAVMDVVGDSMHTELLGEHPSLTSLSHLYANQQERTALFRKMQETEHMKRALAYLDKSLLLSPKKVMLYQSALSVHASFRDLAELKKLQQRFQLAAPDLGEIRTQTLKMYAGTDDKETLASVQAHIKARREAMQQPAIRDHPLTWEYAAVSLVNYQVAAYAFGADTEPGPMLEIAKEAYRRHASSATLHTLRGAHLTAACLELSRQNSEFAALQHQTRHALDAEHLLALVLQRGGSLAALTKQNANVTRAVELQTQINQLFPDWSNVEEWAFLSGFSPELGAPMATSIKVNETTRLVDDLQYMMNPFGAGVVLEQWWTAKLIGDEAHGAEIYRKAVAAGVPLPPL